MNLEHAFKTEFAKLSPTRANHQWDAIVKAHSHSARCYHNLSHLEALFTQLIETKSQINNWPPIVFAIAYHDFKYNVLRQDNEERSAVVAERALSEAKAPPELVHVVKTAILATKSHTAHMNEDINLFTDADLSILGAERGRYEEYVKQIRKEYRIYPDLVYNAGRKKVLAHFLNMRQIFKSAEFSGRFEAAARSNLAWELQTLS